MNPLHCKCCRCMSMQDEPNLLKDVEHRLIYIEEEAIASRLKSNSFSHDVTDGHWLWKTSRPEVINANLKNSFDPSNTLFFVDSPSVSSLGNLVCSASTVSASKHSKLFGAESSLNDTLPQIALECKHTNQAPGRDGQTEDISQGLTSMNHGYTQPCEITEVVDPLALQLGTIAADELLVDNQPPLRSDVPNLLYPAQQSSANLSDSPCSGSFVIASSVAQNLSFVDLGDSVKYDDVLHQSSLQAMHNAQPVIDFQPFLGAIHNDGASISSQQLLFPEIATNSPYWYDEGHQSIDAQPSTPFEGEQSSTVAPAIISSAGQGKGKTKMISVYCCPHHDCDYTAKIWRDVQRHLGSKKHGGSTSRFPCSIEGCNALKENTRRDNLRRHMKTVHGVIMPEMRKRRREKRYRVQSQAQQ